MRQRGLRVELSDTTACAWFWPDRSHLTYRENSSRLSTTLPAHRCGQVKRPFSNLLAQTQSPLPSDEDLQPIALGVAEQEQVPAKRLTRQSIPDKPVQPFKPLAHVGDSGGKINPCGWTQSKHGLHPLQCTHQALECIRIEVTMYLDPAPTR